MKDINMQSKQYPYNMSGWVHEKSKCVISELAQIVDIMNENIEKIPPDVFEDLNDRLHPAIIDATKIYGFACNAKLLGGEGNVIFDEGKNGLEKIMQQFGEIEKTSNQIKFNELHELVQNIENAIKGDKTNRTLIHAALASYQKKIKNIDKEVKKLEDSIESVTMGELPWESFISIANNIIPIFKKELEILSK